jgi:hypothetical protein
MAGLALVILVPALYGFSNKLWEFIVLYGSGEEGSFALMPILNYLIASLGFLLLFCWAVRHGMFHHIEQPKRTMLENEHRLDADDPPVPMFANEEGDEED